MHFCLVDFRRGGREGVMSAGTEEGRVEELMSTESEEEGLFGEVCIASDGEETGKTN
jgi:hypothetical protein